MDIQIPTHRKIATSASAKRYASIMTALAAFCSRPSNDRKLLESVQVQTANDCLRLVATDRFLLGIVDLPVEDGIGDLLEKPVVFAASDIRRLGSAIRGGKVHQADLLIDRTDDGRVELASQRDNTIVTSVPGAYFPNWPFLVPEVSEPSDFCRVALRPRDIERAGALCAVTDSGMVFTSMNRRGATRIDCQLKVDPHAEVHELWHGVRSVILTMPNFEGETTVPAMTVGVERHRGQDAQPG